MAVANVKINPIGQTVIAVTVCLLVLYWYGLPGFLSRNSHSKIDMTELLSASIDLAKLGGDRVRIVRLSNGTLGETLKGKTKEGVKDVATPGDMQSHTAMYYGFVKTFPSLKVISEEHSQKTVDLKTVTSARKQLEEVMTTLPSDKLNQKISSDEITIWIDPLDATKEYTENLLQYVTTMVCVALKGQPVIGVIHWPFSGKTVWGYVDAGYSSNLKQRKVANSPANAKVVISRSHSGGGDVSKFIKDALGAQTEILTAAGAGYKITQVIMGEADAYVHMTRIKKWDLCAGAAILRSLGGTLTTLEGATVDFGPVGSPVNDGGVLATLTGHERFATPLKKAFTTYRQSTKT